MALINWDDKLYSVNVDMIDQHHKTLVDIINKLHDAMMEGKGKELMENILNELNDYTRYHFDAEEKMMIKNDYPTPDYNHHKNEHDSFKNTLTDLLEKFKNDERAISIETFKFLKQWLSNHIQKTDKKLGDYDNSKKS